MGTLAGMGVVKAQGAWRVGKMDRRVREAAQGGHRLWPGAWASWGKNGPLRCEEAQDISRCSNGQCLNRVSPSTFRVPFQSPLEADMARRSLLPDAQRHQGLVRKESAVNGSDLLVSVPDEFALRSWGWQVLWSELPLKHAMMETLRGLV